MMKKMVFPVVLMILAGLVLAAVFSCDNGDSGPSTTTYTGKTTDGSKTVTIEVTDGNYDLKVNGTSISTGTVTKSGNTFTLTPNGGGDPVTVTVSGNLITEITGTITPDDGGDEIEIDILPPFETVAGTWDWSLSDDSKTNEYLDVQTIFAPGGASSFENAVTDPTDIGDDDLPIKRPTIQAAGTVMDDNGNPIDQPVFSFKGTTKVTSDNRSANEGARFPLLGWEAVPDEETLAKLRTAYGYSFWVRLNSSSSSSTTAASKWAFVTTVFTDFPAELGYEYGHWFGNRPGDSGSKNITKDLELGKWHKIEVILKGVKYGGNLDQAAWIHAYNPEYEGDFNQDKATKLQWQVPLQHNGGTARSGAPYDIITGTYTFDLDLYGLELLTTE